MTADPWNHLVSKPLGAAGSDARTAPASLPGARPRTVRRLEQVALVLIAVSLASWFLSNLVQGHLLAEVRDAGQWAPPAATVLASVAIILVTRRPNLSPALVVRAGLVYEVVICFCITFGSSYQAYWACRRPSCPWIASACRG